MSSLITPAGNSQQRVSSLTGHHAALKAKNDLRALAILRAMAPHIVLRDSPALADYPTLNALLKARKRNASNSK